MSEIQREMSAAAGGDTCGSGPPSISYIASSTLASILKIKRENEKYKTIKTWLFLFLSQCKERWLSSSENLSTFSILVFLLGVDL